MTCCNTWPGGWLERSHYFTTHWSTNEVSPQSRDCYFLLPLSALLSHGSTPPVAFSGVAHGSCVALSDLRNSQNPSVCLKLFTLRHICSHAVWTYLVKEVLTCLVKKWFHVVFDCSHYKRSSHQGQSEDQIFQQSEQSFCVTVFKTWGNLNVIPVYLKTALILLISQWIMWKCRKWIKMCLFLINLGKYASVSRANCVEMSFPGSCEGHMLWLTGIVSCVIDSDSLRE